MALDLAGCQIRLAQRSALVGGRGKSRIEKISSSRPLEESNLGIFQHLKDLEKKIPEPRIARVGESSIIVVTYLIH